MPGMTLYLFILTIFSSSCFADKPLIITIDSVKTSYSRETLLHHPALTTLKKISLPGYPGQFFDLQAVPLCSLLKLSAKHDDDLLKIQTFDNYLAHIKLERVYPCDKHRPAIAYIAIEEPGRPWPIIPKLKRSAGTYYLIWQGEGVPQTDWVFGSTAIDLATQSPFSKFLPLMKTPQEIQGLEQFSRKCGNCHSINLTGNLEKGPDLNVPMNPLEYFSEQQLRRYIRNPQSMRYMKNDLMFPFTRALLSDEELDAIIAFLKGMQSHKIASPKSKNPSWREAKW